MYKKLFTLFLVMLMLCGCQAPSDKTSATPGDNSQAVDYPLLLIDTTNHHGEAYTLCSFACGKLCKPEDYQYNGQPISSFMGKNSVPVTSPIIDLAKPLCFFDTKGNAFDAVATALYCTGRVYDEVYEVRVAFDRQTASAPKFYLGTYAGVKLLPDNAEYTDSSIFADMDGNGTTDSVTWTFTPADPVYGDNWDYAVTATRNGITYTVAEKGYLPLQKQDLAVFLADVDQDKTFEIVVYEKGMSRFGTLKIYKFHEEGYVPILTYIVESEP